MNMTMKAVTKNIRAVAKMAGVKRPVASQAINGGAELQVLVHAQGGNAEISSVNPTEEVQGAKKPHQPVGKLA